MNADKRRHGPVSPAEQPVHFAGLVRIVPPGGPRFLPLTKYLQSQPAFIRRLDIYICNLIVMIRDELPPIAYHNAEWWANGGAHEQAAAWLEAGWKATDVDLASGTVAFVRVT